MKSNIMACSVATLVLMAGISPGSSDAAVEQVITGLDEPVRLVAPDGDPRLFVLERPGYIRIFDQQGTELGLFLDISDSTPTFSARGLLGLAFPPDYDHGRKWGYHHPELER